MRKRITARASFSTSLYILLSQSIEYCHLLQYTSEHSYFSRQLTIIYGTVLGQDEIYNHSQHKGTIPDEKLVHGKAALNDALAILVA